MQKENKDFKLQIRIGNIERDMLKKLRDSDPNFNVSSFFRKCLEGKYKDSGLKPIGSLL